MSFGGLFVLVLVLLILANLVRMALRRRSDSDFEDDYFGPASGREIPTSSRRWRGKRGDWGGKIASFDANLDDLKKKAGSASGTAPAKTHDFADLTPGRRKLAAQQVLNQRRGVTVTLHTRAGMVSGKVVTVTSQKVMLRGPEGGPVSAINLDDVLGIV